MAHTSVVDRKCYHTPKDLPLLNYHGCNWMAVSCLLLFFVFSWGALLFGAELFPFTPPSTGQQRLFEQGSQGKPKLSKEDFDRISKTANLAKQLPPDEKKKLKAGIQRDLREAVVQGDLNQVTYFTELLVQIGQENSRP
ncbi:MAG: hypothetical protein IT391_04945 [Nitrospira sp.]|nr:hypothetical protein [Nitrospira sp.]